MVFSTLVASEDVGFHQDPPRLRAQSRRRGGDARVAVAAAGAAKGGAATETAGGGVLQTGGRQSHDWVLVWIIYG